MPLLAEEGVVLLEMGAGAGASSGVVLGWVGELPRHDRRYALWARSTTQSSRKGVSHSKAPESVGADCRKVCQRRHQHGEPAARSAPSRISARLSSNAHLRRRSGSVSMLSKRFQKRTSCRT